MKFSEAILVLVVAIVLIAGVTFLGGGENQDLYCIATKGIGCERP